MTALPPRLPRNFDPLWFSRPSPVSEPERLKLIETAAYFRAQRRAFAAGHETEDWLAAEAEVDLRLRSQR